MDIPLARPPWSKLGKTLESAVRKALFGYQMLEGMTTPLAIALSGGKDSLSLLFLLKAIVGKGMPNIPIIAIHIRQKSSCGAHISPKFLEMICQDLSVPLTIQTSDHTKLDCYACSRERRKLLFSTAHQLGSRHIAFGHHKDDIIQTLLLNMLHKGECATILPKTLMIHYDMTILRPLFYIFEKDLISFAKYYEFYRITCDCPRGQYSKRNTTKQLIKAMEASFPNARQNLFYTAQNYGSQKAQLSKNTSDAS
jgi:tRNA 2-thiocytidine biosynthesis protein TtcA